MDKFIRLSAVAAPMPRANIDTDMIMPQKFLKTIRRTGLGIHAFSNIRYYEDGTEREDFVLNQPAYRTAEILIAGANFGCGSSREHAPWALKDFGLKCIIAPSFADIFYDNCFKNGILPITLPRETIDLLLDDAGRGANAILTVDLERQEITGPDGGRVSFEIDPYRRNCLLHGLDDIDLTLEKQDAIRNFEARRRLSQPWLFRD